MVAQIAASVRTAEADSTGNLLNNAKIRIYSGSAPADVDSAATGTLLAELTMGADAFGAASDDGTNATITANAITDDSSADATGTAGYFRVVDSAGTTTRMQGTVTGTGGGGDMELSNTAITAGGVVQCSSFLYRRPQL